MNSNQLLSRLIIGGLINAVIVWALSKYSPKVATLYTIILLLAALLSYRNEFFNGFNAALNAINSNLS